MKDVDHGGKKKKGPKESHIKSYGCLSYDTATTHHTAAFLPLPPDGALPCLPGGRAGGGGGAGGGRGYPEERPTLSPAGPVCHRVRHGAQEGKQEEPQQSLPSVCRSSRSRQFLFSDLLPPVVTCDLQALKVVANNNTNAQTNSNFFSFPKQCTDDQRLISTI